MSVFQLSLLWFFGTSVFCALSGAAFADTLPTQPDYSKPLFTRFQTPICETRDDLATLVSLARTGRRDLLEQVRGCRTSQSGIPVAVLDRQGILDVWVRARLITPDGDQPIFWTVGLALRNESPVITGDPAKGRVKICITRGYDSIHVPPLSVFTNAGHLIGDLRDEPLNSKSEPDFDYEHAAIVTMQAADLTRGKPCTEVDARMFVRDEFTVKSWPASTDEFWDFDHVLGYPVGILEQPGKLELVQKEGGLRAVVSADLGNPLSTSDEDAARSESDNPLNSIHNDLKLAGEEPLEGPDGKGNFRVCLWKDIDNDQNAQPLTVPSNLIFESLGRLTSDLRDSNEDNKWKDLTTRWAVITTKSFTLSRERPCAIISVRSVISNSRPWLFPLVRETDQLYFSPLVIRGEHEFMKLSVDAKNSLYPGMLNGTPVADIGRSLDLRDERL